MIRALDRKLLRDLARLWAQALAIAMVLACGVMTILMSVGMSAALDETRDAYYERNRFADVFANVVRAPRTLEPEIAAIPGVAAAETRVTGEAILGVPGRERIAAARFIGLPEAGPPRLNLPLLRTGVWPDPDDEWSVVVNEAFADANALAIGDTFHAILNGTKRRLTVAGTALSPEFIYTIGPGALMPDDAGYGIIWIPRRAAEAAWDMSDAFNDIAVALLPGTSEDEVIDAIDRLLEPYGGFGAHGRDLQISNSFLDAEVDSLRVIAYVLPPVFLAVSAFLVSMVFGRIVAMERAEIGVLKALGYTSFRICMHYIVLAGLVACVGLAIGWVAGELMARYLAEIYARFYEFPYLIYRMPGSVYGISAAAGLSAATLGAARSAYAAAQLAPAVAMAPPGPTAFKRGAVNEAIAGFGFSQPTLMILRDLIRHPFRSLQSMLGLSLAVAVLVAAGFFGDAIDHIVDRAFDLSNRQDATLIFSEDRRHRAIPSVRNLPGVLQAEPQTYAAVILRNGHREKRTTLEGRPPATDLSRVVDDDGRVLQPMPGTVVLSDRLADQLGVAPGDALSLEFVDRPKELFSLPVSGLVTQSFGLGAYADAATVDRLLRRGPQLTAVNVTLDGGQEAAFHAALKEVPGVSGTIMMNENRVSFTETVEQNILIMTSVYGVLAILITVGVAYNGARVQLSERARELASLRILGFTTGEVIYVLVGQMLILVVLAQPLGWWIGARVARYMTESFTSDLYAIPLVLLPATYSTASLVVLAVTALALAVVARRVARLDLVAVMKTRE